MMKLGIAPGSRVIEAGTGSGGLCLALATAVGDDGHVYSYDIRTDMQVLAKRNLERTGLNNRVTLKRRDAQEGFDEEDVDAVFLDLLIPHVILNQARAALRGGGVLGCLVPTANQVIDLLNVFATHREFAFVEVEELILRSYKPVAARFRPEDHIIGHTGYLVFARAVMRSSGADPQPPPEAEDVPPPGQEEES
jgi:tRNA (adenine57-N1/adenine58-N1)-methyltransferase